ncbi:terminase large subunit [Treponema pectinovorum]|uniref:terminase large subunit n=1 Tax=Treponema pectinovorum TaxID=164 RepID=UPI0011C9B248|nr:terminase TerL endonuclease subunit [Treponema pectinovorum]
MKDYDELLGNYIDDITNEKIKAGIYTKKSIKRFLSDIKKSKNKDYPYYFDMPSAQNLLAFAEELKPADMDGKKIQLLNWQIFCLANLEGWRWKNDKNRKRYRSAYIEVNRKNGKTTGLLVPLVLFNFLKYKSSESYLISSDDKLAEKTYKEIVDIINEDGTLKDILNPLSKTICFKDIQEKSRLAFYCDGGKTPDGLRPRFFCLDEYHLFSDDKILDSMVLGMRSKKDAQGVIITTADTNITCPCYEQHLKSKRILNGLQEQDDFFCVIYAIDEDDDFHNSETWIKANPSLYEIIDPSVIKSDIENAELTPHKIPELKAKTFGIWGGGSQHSWLSVEIWQKNKDISVNFEDFKGECCYGGLDLAQVDDLCAFSICFKKNGKFYFKHRFYIPQKTVYERYKKENVNFLSWVENGIITATPGETTDYNFIIKDILESAHLYNLKGLGFDKWQSRAVIQGVEEILPNLPLIEVAQNLQKLSPLTKEYEKAIKDGFVVDNSPVMLWMINNTEVRPDENGNYKPMKKSKASNAHIDGVISSIMAFSVMNSELANIEIPDIKDCFF